MTPLWIILIWIFAIFGKQILDYFQIHVQKKSPPHGPELVLMCIIACFHLTLAGVWEKGWAYAINLAAFDAFSYWSLFDGGLNLMLKRGWLAIGKTAKTDIYFQKHPILYKWTKIICGTLTIVSGTLIFLL